MRATLRARVTSAYFSNACVRPLLREEGLPCISEVDEDAECEGDDDVERIKLDPEDDVIKKLKDPRLPSQDEVERHCMRGHIPYRDWCHVCVKAMGKALQPRRVDKKSRIVPEYRLDYCFPWGMN